MSDDTLKVLIKIKKTSLKILTQILEIADELLEENCDLVDEVHYCTKAKKETILEWFEQETFRIIEDERRIIKEIDLFIDAYKKGSDVLEKNEKEYTLLAEIWHGDAY